MRASRAWPAGSVVGFPTVGPLIQVRSRPVGVASTSGLHRINYTLHKKMGRPCCRPIFPCQSVPGQAGPGQAPPCRAIPCSAPGGRSNDYRASLPCLTTPGQARPHHALPSPAVPNPAVPWPARRVRSPPGCPQCGVAGAHASTRRTAPYSPSSWCRTAPTRPASNGTSRSRSSP